MKALLGGSSSSSSSKSGYSALSPQLQALFNPFAAAINAYTLPSFGTGDLSTLPGKDASTLQKSLMAGNAGKFGNGNKYNRSVYGQQQPTAPDSQVGNPGVADLFTPLGIQPGEQAAMDAIAKGFTPTEDSLRADIGMQMNPYNDSVINQINQQGNGQYSILKQALQEAGQSGSNRQALGANDIDLTRMNQIGGFLNNQFNTSLQNALTTLPQARTADAQNELSIADFLRKLDMQTKQAPITAIQTGTQLMSPFLSGGTATSSSSSTGGLLPALAGLARPAPA